MEVCMIQSINFSAYQQIARMQSNIDNMIQQAINAKSQIGSQLNFSIMPAMAGIGSNVDMLV
jgi:hypothetical protein